MAHLAPGRAASRPICRTSVPVPHSVPRALDSLASTTAHRRCIARASSNGAAAPTDWDAVYAGQALPGQYAGPIEVQPTEGKGRGLVATRDVAAGELLLVDAPLLYLTADSEGTTPTVQQLKEKLDAGRFSAHELAWLRALTAGEGLAPPGLAPDLGQGPTTSAEAGDLQAVNGLDDARKTKVLELNRFSGPCPDLAVSAIRGEEPVPFMGLWPQFALFNHSCAPNAEWLTLHDRLVVRASKDVSKGSELTVSYLGPQTLRPAAERLMDLREDRDMACACPRCAVEMDDEYGPLIAAVHQADALVTTDIVPNLQASLAEGGLGNPRALEVVEGALDRLQPVLASLEQQLGSSAGGNGGGPLAPELAGWMRASAYQAYSVQAQLLDLLLEIKAGGPEEAAAAAKLMAYESFVMGVAAAVLPASDAQLLQAVKVWARAQQAYGAEGAEVHQAEARAMQVLRLRYGPGLKEETVARLVQATAASLLSE